MPPKKDAALPGHIARLDVVRALAFLSVYAFHLAARFAHANVPWRGFFHDYSVWPRAAWPLLPAGFGWLGVALFYVLSGFCIHYATMTRKTPFKIADFYGRRFLRIYPAYIVCVIVFSCLSPWLPYHYFNVWQVVAHVLMVHNFLKATIFGIDGVLWSLAVEIQFYLLYPFLLYLARRWRGLDRCLVLALALNVACQVYFGVTGKSWSPVQTTWSFPLVTWCDWILGACLADAYVRGVPLFPRKNLWLIVNGIFLASAVNYKILNAQSFLFASVFFAVLLERYLAVKAPLQGFERLLIPIGLTSYSLYLWHEPLMILVNQGGAKFHLYATPLQHVAFDVILTTLVLVPLAGASYYFLEVRAPAFIRQFLKKRHLAAPPLPGPALPQPLSR